jgi:PKD repeat protein
MKGMSGSVAMRVGVIGIFAVLLVLGVAGLMQANAGVSPQYNITATIQASTSQGPAPLTVTFQAVISGAGTHDTFTYSWNFGDGQTSTAASPQHVFTNPKTYTVSLTVTDVTAKQNVVAQSYNIIATGGVSVVQSSITATNEGSGLYQFSASASGGTPPYTYHWSFGDTNTGVSTTQTIEHTYTKAGTYTVTVFVTDNNGLTSNSATYQLTVSTSPASTNGASNSGTDYTWLIVVVLVVVAAILGVLIWRKYFHRTPPKDANQSTGGYDQNATYAPYQYGGAESSAPTPTPNPGDVATQYPDPTPPSPTSPEESSMSAPEPAADAVGGAGAAASAAPSSDPGSKTCFVCGGALSENNFCSKCQMDWGQPAGSPTGNPA